jgi:glutathione S-transferase
MIRKYFFSYAFPKTAEGRPDRKAIDAVVPVVENQNRILDQAVAKTGHLGGDQLTFRRPQWR